jgi:hypothetical protein
MNEKVHLSDKFIDKLCLTSNINKVWINKNIGYMLNNDDALHLINEPSSNYDKIENQRIPLIPIEAMAGFGNGSVTVMDVQKYIVQSSPN